MEQSQLPTSAKTTSDLGSLLELGLAAERPWLSDELGAVLEDHLAAPIEFTLAALRPMPAAKLRDLTAHQGLWLRSLRELLQYPLPPIQLLVMMKDSAKACRQATDAPLPKEVASVIYYLCIAAALLRLGQKITSLSDHELRDGMDWVLGQPWVDEGGKLLVRQAQHNLQASQG